MQNCPFLGIRIATETRFAGRVDTCPRTGVYPSTLEQFQHPVPRMPFFRAQYPRKRARIKIMTRNTKRHPSAVLGAFLCKIAQSWQNFVVSLRKSAPMTIFFKEALNKARFTFTRSSVVSAPQAQSLRGSFLAKMCERGGYNSRKGQISACFRSSWAQLSYNRG